MASTPTDPGTPGGSDPGAGHGGPGYGAYTAMGRDIARMPIPIGPSRSCESAGCAEGPARQWPKPS